jgi:DNA-binding NtrC family response regulator
MSKDINGGAPKQTAVLCVDSNADANAVVGNIIELDAELWTVNSFNAALEAIRQRSYDLVICDITSPPLRGLDVLSILSSLYPSTPVVVTSEPGVAGWTSDAFAELGAFAGMMKPYNKALLKEAIIAALWPTPVMGKGDLGRAVLLNAAIHETAASEMAQLTEEERGEIRDVCQVLERLSPFVK